MFNVKHTLQHFFINVVGSDEEDATAALSVRLQEEALQARGKLFLRVAKKVTSELFK